jgi:hypothetical protein
VAADRLAPSPRAFSRKALMAGGSEPGIENRLAFDARR